MSEDRRHVQHYHTTNPDAIPSPEALYDGEIALNIAADNEKIYVKNTDGEIATFRDDKYYQEVISGAVSTKQDELVSGDNIKTINGESILGSGNIESLASKEYVDEKSDSKVFIGTLAEYQEAYAAGKIAVGALVIIMEEGEDANDTIALLGTAVLGKMILGQK